MHKHEDLSSNPWYSKTGTSVHAFSSSMRRQRQAEPQSSLASLQRQNCFRFIVKYGLKGRQRGVRDRTGCPTHPPALDTHTCMHAHLHVQTHTHTLKESSTLSPCTYGSKRLRFHIFLNDREYGVIRSLLFLTESLSPFLPPSFSRREGMMVLGALISISLVS